MTQCSWTALRSRSRGSLARLTHDLDGSIRRPVRTTLSFRATTATVLGALRSIFVSAARLDSAGFVRITVPLVWAVAMAAVDLAAADLAVDLAVVAECAAADSAAGCAAA